MTCRITPLIFVLIIMITQMGCTSAESLAKNHLLAEIDVAEALWHSQSISNYRITVTFTSTSRMQTENLSVQDGIVTAHSTFCGAPLAVDGTCLTTPFEQGKFTVEGLFGQAREYVALVERGEHTLEAISFEFDPVYGYPKRISWNPAGYLDAWSVWIVEEFEVLS